MRVSTKIVLLIETGELLERESFEYHGPTAEAIQFGGNKSKQKSQQQSQQTSESGTRFNPEFLKAAAAFASGKNYDPNKRAQTQAEIDDLTRQFNESGDAVGSPLYNRISDLKNSLDTGDEVAQGPEYNPSFVRGEYNPSFVRGEFTPVAGGDFDRLEKALYEGSQSRLSQAYNAAVARQREELSQMGALTSPTQFLEGSARSALDRSYLDSLQQAAREAATTSLGLKAAEAGRKTEFSRGEAGRETEFNVDTAKFSRGEAGRETEFNVDTATKILQNFLQKLGIAIESGRYSTGQGTSSGSSSGNSFGGNFGFLT